MLKTLAMPWKRNSFWTLAENRELSFSISQRFLPVKPLVRVFCCRIISRPLDTSWLPNKWLSFSSTIQLGRSAKSESNRCYSANIAQGSVSYVSKVVVAELVATHWSGKGEALLHLLVILKILFFLSLCHRIVRCKIEMSARENIRFTAHNYGRSGGDLCHKRVGSLMLEVLVPRLFT